MKLCNLCGVTQPLANFWKQDGGQFGVFGRCKVCMKEVVAMIPRTIKQKYAKKWYSRNQHYYKQWAINNKDKRSASREKWKREHPELAKQAMRRSCAKHREERRLRSREWRMRNLAKSAAFSALRRYAVRRAHPKWANNFFIEEIYHLAHLRSKTSGIQHHVDHIVPLVNPLVCGLHNEFNLRVVPAYVNLSKKNTFSNAHTDP